MVGRTSYVAGGSPAAYSGYGAAALAGGQAYGGGKTFGGGTGQSATYGGKGKGGQAGVTAYSGPTITTNITSPTHVSKGELAYLGALANVNAGVSGWGLGTLGPGNAYGMAPGLTGVPGFIGGQSTSWGQWIGNAIKMAVAGLSGPWGIPRTIVAGEAEGGTFGPDAAALAKSLSVGQLGPGLAKALGLPGGYVAPQAGLPGQGPQTGPGSAVTGSIPSPLPPPVPIAPPEPVPAPVVQTATASATPYAGGLTYTPLPAPTTGLIPTIPTYSLV
jgi:hypothetical protein